MASRYQDEDSRPLNNVNYSQAYQNEPAEPYQYQSATNPMYAVKPRTSKKNRKPLWIALGVLAVLVIVGAVVGGVLGSRSNKNNSVVLGSSSTASGDNGSSGSSASGAAATKTLGSANQAVVPTATDAWGNPLYPTTTGSAVIAAPTTLSNASLSCGSDPYSFSTSTLTVRTDHPVLFAPAYKWQCLPKLIAGDSYMASWNDTIFLNATRFAAMPPTNYSIDGGLTGSGVLDVAREVQLRIKHWGYAYKMSNDTKWVDRAWLELQTAAGNSTTGQYFGVAGNNWNTGHFLDVAEFTAAFAIAYDWMYDAWQPAQKQAIMWSIINLGLQYGNAAYNDPTGAGANFEWWTKVNGNWNCVCNNGLTLGALAIASDDPTGISGRILAATVPNAAANCAMGPSADGTWSETANYWYFGTTGHSQMAAALQTATGSTWNLLESNPGMKLSALYHMYVTGMQGLFAYGDTGPNKYTATANGLMYYGSHYNIPMYTLFQRDRGDAPEPMSMLWYDPQVSGQFWDGLALDAHFSNTSDAWAAMRTSWTNTNGAYIAIKSGGLLNHQTHGNLDAGDFVLDALGQRWAGELGSGNYLADGYFSNETQTSDRWLYYRTRTAGQNTLLIGGQNQIVTGVPSTKFDSTGDKQDALVYTPPRTSTSYFTTDLSAVYGGTSVQRAIRFINARQQILLQDEIAVPAAGAQWRMHTNATIVLSDNGATATLSLGGKTLIAKVLSPPGAAFVVQQPVRLASAPALPMDAASQDQSNAPASVLTVTLSTPGQQTLEVLFNPQWPNLSASSYLTPASVPISGWSLTSHQ